MRQWPSDRVLLGADYNPEQWPAETIDEDVALLAEAGVGFLTVGVFAWALLEPRPGEYELDWLDALLDRLATAEVAVDLATATASPPPWFARLHPEALPVTREGTRLSHGSRQSWCPSSPRFRERSLALVERLARRYHDHPALAMWHVSNELGCHNAACYCEVSADHFRRWLLARYGDLTALNEAWGTTVWSQRYTDLADVVPPRATTTFGNPVAALDWSRFCSDALLAQHVAERELLHELSPGVPVTTNFMVTTYFRDADYWRWAPEQDVVSNDHYLDLSLPHPEIELALAADLTRGLAGGAPWVLMEHSTSATSWQPVNPAKHPGQLLRNSLAHVGRGADAVGFFQWRASAVGAERFHSALVPHAGPDSERWREAVELGRVLATAAELAGSRVAAEVALVWDYESRWATDAEATPSGLHRYLDEVLAWYGALWRANLSCDVLPPGADATGYRLLLVPSLHLCSDAAAAAVTAAADAGAEVVVTYFSGLADELGHVRLGGYPGAFRDLLGVRVEELGPLLAGRATMLRVPSAVSGATDPTRAGLPGSVGALRPAGLARLDGTSATLWTERLRVAPGTEVLAVHDPAERGPQGTAAPWPGTPALTRRERPGGGAAWYAATRFDDRGLDVLVAALSEAAGVSPALAGLPPGVEAIRRWGAVGSWLVVLDHTEQGAAVPAAGVDLVSGVTCSPENPLRLPPGGSAVIREG